MYKTYIDEVFFIIYIEVNKKYSINIKLNLNINFHFT